MPELSFNCVNRNCRVPKIPVPERAPGVDSWTLPVAAIDARQRPRDCFEGLKQQRARPTDVSNFAVAARAIKINVAKVIVETVVT